MNAKKIILYDNDAGEFNGLEVENIGSGFQFTEGPLWHPDGFLLFSDIPANKIYRLSPGRPAIVYLGKSGFTGDDNSLLSDMTGSNGLAWNNQGQLIICQHGNHAIAALDKKKKVHTLTDVFLDRPYNSPNDLAISRDGRIYFTDPPYGLKNQVLYPAAFQDKAGVYCYYKEKTKLLSHDLRYPNGICFSSDEQYLYVSSNHPDEPFVLKYTLSKDGSIQHPSVLIEQNADGIKTDDAGKLYLATDKGVLIISSEGKRLAMINLPETPSNLAWGGPRYKELYVTARSTVWRIKNFVE